MNVTDLRLDGQAAIVTGASSGLGVVVAHALAVQGCAVVLAARRADRLATVAAEITAGGGRAVAHPCDVRDPGHADALAEACVAAFGRLDGVIANAGAADGRPAESHDSQAFSDVLAVNVEAVANLAGACARVMIGGGRGWMILQSSILGRRAGTGPGVAAYTASKGAVEQLTRELARQWAPYGIRVNALAAGYFSTDMNEIGRASCRERV